MYFDTPKIVKYSELPYYFDCPAVCENIIHQQRFTADRYSVKSIRVMVVLLKSNHSSTVVYNYHQRLSCVAVCANVKLKLTG